MYKKSKNFNPVSYKEMLEEKTASELVDILRTNGKMVKLKENNRKKLIEMAIKLKDNEIEKKRPAINNDPLGQDIMLFIFSNILNLSIIFIFILFIQAFFFWIGNLNFRKHQYCNSISKSTKCIQCPANAICNHYSINCIENYLFINGFCLPKHSLDPKLLSKFIEQTKNELKKRAGLYKCGESRFDWMSQDEIENMLIKFYSQKAEANTNFGILFNSTIEYLMNETDIITKNIEDSTIFTAINFSKSLECNIKSFVSKNIIFYIIAIIICTIASIIYFNSKNDSICKNQAYQSLRTLVNFIKSFNGNEVSQTEVKALLNQMYKNHDKVWKYSKKLLDNSVLIGWKKEGNQIYYFSKNV